MRFHFLLYLVAAAVAAGGEWQTLGPFGGSAAIVRVDRHHSHTLLAATSNARIFRSEDDGGSWSPLPFPAEFRATLHAFALDQRNPDVYLAGLSSDTAEYSGILRSEDGGLTWKRIPDPKLRAVWSIAIQQDDSRVIAAGTEDGLIVTRDGGDTWDRITPQDDPELKTVVSVSFDPWNPETLYVGTPHLAWKTSDGGELWQSIHDGMLDDSDVFSVLADGRDRHKFFAATCGGIYRSLDDGAAWTKLTEAKGASFRTYHIAQNPFQPAVLLAGTSLGLVKSTDGGDTWRRLTARSTRFIEFDPLRPNVVFIATDDAGLFRSDDAGETLQSINEGFGNRNFVTLTTADNTLYVATLTAGGTSILRRTDSESEWHELSGPDLQSVQAEMENLAKAPDGAPRQVSDELRIHDVVPAEGGELLAAASRGLARSDDAGMTWELAPGMFKGTTVSALYRHPIRAGVYFASVFGEIYRSQDYGLHWTPLSANPEHPNDFIALRILPGRTDWLFALSRSRGVYAMALSAE